MSGFSRQDEGSTIVLRCTLVGSGKYDFFHIKFFPHTEWHSFQFASGYPTEEELDNLNNLDINLLLSRIIINDEYITCVRVRWISDLWPLNESKVLNVSSFFWNICQKDAISQIMEENEDLQWWFEDIEKTVIKLVGEAKGCLSGDEQLSVFSSY